MTETALTAGLDTFRDTFTAAYAEHPEDAWRTAGRKTKASPKGEDFNWWLENGQQMVRDYHTWRRNNPDLVIWDTPAGIPAIEVECNVTLEDGTIIKGFIDRVFQDFGTGELLIVDLKSGNNTPVPLQLGVYRVLLEETFGVSPKFGAYWMARKGSLDEIHDLDKLPTVMVKRWLRDTAKMIRSDFVVPHLSRSCDWCGVKPYCYAWGSDHHTPDFTSDIHLTQEGK